MRRITIPVVAITLIGGGALVPLHRQTSPVKSVPAKPALDEKKLATYQKSPANFETNVGQAPSDIKYVAHGDGHTLLLSDHDAVLVADKSAVRMRLAHRNPKAVAEALEPQSAKVNYLIGNDRSQWRTNVSTYGRVRYRDVYPGVDMIFYGTHKDFEYDLIIDRNADPSAIRMSFDGARSVELNAAGALELKTATGEIVQRKPEAYQYVKGEKRDVQVAWRAEPDGTYGMNLGDYDRSEALIVDPIISSPGKPFVSQSTFLGGTDGQTAPPIQTSPFGITGNPPSFVFNELGLRYGGAEGVTAISDGDFSGTVVAGTTLSLNYPVTAGASQTKNHAVACLDEDIRSFVCATYSQDAFVTKLDSLGKVVFSTYLGGTTAQLANGVATNGNGEVAVTGGTLSPDFPVTPNAFQPVSSVNGDVFTVSPEAVFVTELSSDGTSLLYSTFLGNQGRQYGTAIKMDANGFLYVGGYADNNPCPPNIGCTFPVTANAFQPHRGSPIIINTAHVTFDSFVAVFDPSMSGSSSLVYSTLFGGNGYDYILGLAVDGNRNVYVTGATTSTDLPVTPGALQATNHGGYDAFVSKIDTQSGNLIYLTYLGGAADDSGHAITVNTSDNSVALAGLTYSAAFPTTSNGYQRTYGGNGDAFVTAIDGSGTMLTYSTFLGGSLFDEANAINSNGNTWQVAGDTTSQTFPMVSPVQTSLAGGSDAFVARFENSVLTFSSFFGGSGDDYAAGISRFGYFAGLTQSYDLPILNFTQGYCPNCSTTKTKAAQGFAAAYQPSACLADYSDGESFVEPFTNGRVAAGGLRYDRVSSSYAQSLTVTDTGSGPMGAPGVVITNLVDAALANRSGISQCFVANTQIKPGDPTVRVPGVVLLSGQSSTVSLNFILSGSNGPKYQGYVTWVLPLF